MYLYTSSQNCKFWRQKQEDFSISKVREKLALVEERTLQYKSEDNNVFKVKYK